MTAARVKVLVEDVPQRAALGPLPDGVELVAEPAPDVEMVVLGLGLMRQVPALFGELEGLRVVQAIFAGVDGIRRQRPAGSRRLQRQRRARHRGRGVGARHAAGAPAAPAGTARPPASG